MEKKPRIRACTECRTHKIACSLTGRVSNAMLLQRVQELDRSHTELRDKVKQPAGRLNVHDANIRTLVDIQDRCTVQVTQTRGAPVTGS